MLSICREFLSNRRQRVLVDGSTSRLIQSFQACHREVCWVHTLFILYTSEMFELVWRTVYIPMQMTPHYWELLASQQTDLLLVPPFSKTCLGYRSSAITGA